jgi:hypothetical protein
MAPEGSDVLLVQECAQMGFMGIHTNTPESGNVVGVDLYTDTHVCVCAYVYVCARTHNFVLWHYIQTYIM